MIFGDLSVGRVPDRFPIVNKEDLRGFMLDPEILFHGVGHRSVLADPQPDRRQVQVAGLVPLPCFRGLTGPFT